MAAAARGRPDGTQTLPFTNALRAACIGADGDMGKLRKIADALVRKAVSGEIQAITAVADRLDGKPQQSIEVHKTVEVAVVDARQLSRAIVGILGPAPILDLTATEIGVQEPAALSDVE